MTLAPAISGKLIRETFREWNAERESLDAELSESLAALEAYQHNLDVWQQQLAREREDLQTAREQFENDRQSADKNHSETSAATITELHAAREKITALTTLLLNRTEELRTLDNRRSEVQTELELSRARERDLKAALDDEKKSVEDARSQWADELKQLREMMERQLDEPAAEDPVEAVELPPPPAPASKTPSTPRSNPSSAAGAELQQRENPVLGTIAEQFGKLRQQRAVERQSQQKQR
jgi:DNA repair exonuclease SbcCD ATPase subunit